MSGEVPAEMSDTELLAAFAAACKGVGAIRGLVGTIDAIVRGVAPTHTDPASFPERLRSGERLEAIVAEMRRRKTTEGADSLLDDDDPDVRTVAGHLLRGNSPEKAEAAIAGALNARPTSEVLAAIRSAREPIPQSPSLAELSDDGVVARFEDVAKRESATRFLNCVEDERDMDDKNRIILDLCNTMRELKRRGLLERLFPLMEHFDVTVRREAAVACLRVNEPKAIATLDGVWPHDGPDDYYAARNALLDWRTKGSVVWGM